MDVLVTGATGLVGGAVVPELVRRGHFVRIAARNASEAADRFERAGLDVEPFDTDVTHEEGLRGAADGCDALVHLAGAIESDDAGRAYRRVNVEGTRLAVAEAERADVRRFVHLSALGVDRARTEYQRSKLESEEAVRTFPREWVVLRAGGVYGPRDQGVTLLLRTLRTSPVVPVVGDGRQPFQPLWHEDLAKAVVAALERDDVVGRTLEIAGEDVTSARELAERLGELIEERPRFVSLPPRLAAPSSRLAVRLGLTPPLNGSRLRLLVEAGVVDPPESNALRALGVTPTPLDEGLRSLLHDLPLQTPFEGIGPVLHKTYRVPVRHAKRSPDELIALFRERCVEVMPIDFHAEPGAARRLDEGNTLAVRVPLRGNVLMRVVEVEPRRVTIATVEGHAISGAVRFSAEHDDGGVAFVIDVHARASNWLDRAAMGTFGRFLEDLDWKRTARRAAALADGRVRRRVERHAETLRGSEAEMAAERIARLGRNVERPQTMA